MGIISILGCGWYGKAVAKSLLRQGYHVKGSTTSKAKMVELKDEGIEAFHINLDEGFDFESCREFFNCDVLIICCNSKMDGSAYLSALQKLCFSLKKIDSIKVVFISSISIYGDPNSIVDELTPPNPNKASGVLLIQAENIFTNCSHLNVCIVRFGGLVGPGRMPGRFFSEKVNVPNGMAPVNMIHLEDCIGITNYIIKSGVPKVTVNGVSPHHPIRSDFYLKAAQAEGLINPTFVEELKNWKHVNSIYIGSYLNYQFIVDNWFEWFEKSSKNI